MAPGTSFEIYHTQVAKAHMKLPLNSFQTCTSPKHIFSWPTTCIQISNLQNKLCHLLSCHSLKCRKRGLGNGKESRTVSDLTDGSTVHLSDRRSASSPWGLGRKQELGIYLHPRYDKESFARLFTHSTLPSILLLQIYILWFFSSPLPQQLCVKPTHPPDS